MAATAIKVPSELRERSGREAKEREVTAAAFLADALDELDRRRRWDEVRRGYAALSADEEYWEEPRAWGASLADGLIDA